MITIEITQRCFRIDGTDGEARVRIAFNAGHFETCQVLIDCTDCGVLQVHQETVPKSSLARTLEVAAMLLADDLTGSHEGETNARFFGAADSAARTGEIPGTLRVEEVAAQLGIARSTVYQQIKEGKIPALKFGRSRRVSQTVVDRMIADGKMPEPSPANQELTTPQKRPGRR